MSRGARQASLTELGARGPWDWHWQLNLRLPSSRIPVKEKKGCRNGLGTTPAEVKHAWYRRGQRGRIVRGTEACGRHAMQE